MNKKSNIIYGTRVLIEAIRSGQHLERVFIRRDLKGEFHKELMESLHRTSTPVSKVPVERINRFTKKNHQGVVALVSPIQYHPLEHLVQECYEKGNTPLILILDEITDIRNFGAISRTAECLGVDGVVIPSKRGTQINEDVIKISVGAFNYLPVCREKNLLTTVMYLKESGINIVSCSEKAGKTLDQINFTLPTAIIMGSEERGISLKLQNLSDDIVKVPLLGSIESLNVGVATGIALYEVQRQRKS